MSDSRRRVLDVLNHKIPDRVPIYEVLIDPPMVEYITGIQGKNSAMLKPEELVPLYQKIGLDGIICGLKFWRPTAYMENQCTPMSSVPRPDPAEVQFYLERADKTARLAHEEGLAVAAYTHGCFDVVYEALGFENFMMLLYDDMDYVQEVCETLFQYHLESVKAALQTEVDWIVIGDDIAFKTGLFIRPEMFLDLWKERESRLVKTVLEAGKKVEFHTDGKLDFILPHLIEMGVSLLNPIEPYSNDIREIKRQYGNQIALRGNLDIAGNLAFGTPQDVYEETRHLVHDLKEGGNWVCSTSHSISKAVVPENYFALVKAVRDFGTY